MKVTKKEQYAYAAGIFDGEGWVSIYHYKRPKGHLYGGEIAVKSTTKQLIVWLQKEFGGNFHVPKRILKNKQGYLWRQFGSNAIITLIKFFPYLIVKKQHAAIYFKFYKSILKTKNMKAGLDKVTIQERDKLIDQIHKLAKGGE